MRLMVYTIYDTAAKAYMRPFFLQSDGQAIRSFSDLALDADHEVGRHPEDYSLYRIGFFDDNTAEIFPDQKECLITAQEALAAARTVNSDSIQAFNKEVDDATIGNGSQLRGDSAG